MEGGPLGVGLDLEALEQCRCRKRLAGSLHHGEHVVPGRDLDLLAGVTPAGAAVPPGDSAPAPATRLFVIHSELF